MKDVTSLHHIIKVISVFNFRCLLLTNAMKICSEIVH